MTVLSQPYRKLLERVTTDARAQAESACRAALENLAVHERDYRAHMSVEQRLLRNRLRARGRALGDTRDARTGAQGIRHLTELAAYEHWHRLLFTRFLTENHLLITDDANGSVPITLEECEELAPELGARDGLDLACRFASLILPGVFRRDDPVLDLPIAINDQVELRKLLATLPSECFLADDALGWTYQFWQAQRKDEVNASGKEIGADELSPVTQLFTEDYMVEFLLHNTVGAWWAGKLGPIKASTEEEARARATLSARGGIPAIAWTYLRFVLDETTKTWLPAAGIFDTWPTSANLIRLLDPCMGSGHFLVFALPLLVRLRMEEEGLTAPVAVVAVLQDNLHGLELDERCTQIAAFNVALTAWKLAGYQILPSLHLACSGLAPSATEAEWIALAKENGRARIGMARLHSLFKDAPVLGSLINPRAQSGNLFEAEFHELAPLLTAALAPGEAQKAKFENDAVELAVTAQGLTKAAELLGRQFTLVITNVPYLGSGGQTASLQNFCESVYPDAKADLATCFVERCLEFCDNGGSTALVTTQNWLFLGSYKKLRKRLLERMHWNCVVRLGEKAFQSPQAAGAFVALVTLSSRHPVEHDIVAGLDASGPTKPYEKAYQMQEGMVVRSFQREQLLNSDSIFSLQAIKRTHLLGAYGVCVQGISTGDNPRVTINYWEIPEINSRWKPFQGPPERTQEYAGRNTIVDWSLLDQGFESAAIRGHEAWERKGVAIGQMRSLPATLFEGSLFSNSTPVIVPQKEENLAAFWLFCRSPQLNDDLRKLNPKVSVDNGYVSKVPFDLAYWQRVAAEKYPNGLPKPQSADPTQWLFNGHPKGSEQPLHVAVTRLLGYHWPRQTGSSFPDCPALSPDGLESFADEDGIVCLPPLNREQPAADRLRQLLTAALGAFDERALLTAAGLKGSKSNTLEDWLRDEFFEQHAKLFHDRPFIWHLWDGRADGFHALVNYHKLDHAALQKLTYTHLGDWIRQQNDDLKEDKPGAAARLGAARNLQTRLAAILEGQAPLDIFVRWKSIKDQAQGWHPDLNDGVRQNIRPFLFAGDVGKKGAGLFRSVPLKLNDKDRGTEPARPKKDFPWFWCEEEPSTDPTGGKEFVGTRWNNVHLTLTRKQQA